MPKSKEAKNSSKGEKKDKTKKPKKGDKAKDALKAGQKDKPKKKKKTRRNALKMDNQQFDAVIDILRGPNSDSFKKAMIGHWMDEHEKEQAALKKEGVI